MNTFYDKMPPLIVAIGQSTSNYFTKADYQDAITIGIFAPASFVDAFTYTFEVTDEYEGLATSWVWKILQAGDPVADLSPPLAAKCRLYYELPMVGAFRIKGSGVATASATYKVSKYWGAR